MIKYLILISTSSLVGGIGVTLDNNFLIFTWAIIHANIFNKMLEKILTKGENK